MRVPKVSVIVAAYNAEKYLNRCLDSIAAQTLQDWECIVVDDGSKDRTGIIADEYAAKDARFQVIHKENGGVASARETGIENALGEYTIHADSDDWVDKSMLEELFNCAQKHSADMVICDYYEITNGGEYYSIQNPKSNDRITIWGKMMNSLAGSLWNKLIRKDCYERFHIRFEIGINDEEDKLICLKLLSHEISVTYINRAFYHYDKTQNLLSLSNSGYSPIPRLRILENIRNYTDITPIQSYYDNAIFYIAYHALPLNNSPKFNYISVFRPYRKSINRAAGFPLRSKVLVWLRMIHIPVPVTMAKRLFKRS